MVHFFSFVLVICDFISNLGGGRPIAKIAVTLAKRSAETLAIFATIAAVAGGGIGNSGKKSIFGIARFAANFASS